MVNFKIQYEENIFLLASQPQNLADLLHKIKYTLQKKKIPELQVNQLEITYRDMDGDEI